MANNLEVSDTGLISKQSRYYQLFILSVILMNSVELAAFDYSDRDCLTVRNKVLSKASNVFTIIFTGELVLEIISKGLIFHKTAYLRNGWSILDCLVVVSG